MDAAAASIIGSVIDHSVGCLFTCIPKELGYWCFANKNVEAMNREMKRLTDAAEEIKRQMEQNEVTDIPLPPHVSSWLNQVEQFNKEATTIPADGIGIGWKRYKAGKHSADILENIKNQVGDIPQFESVGERVLARVPYKNHASTSSAPVDDSTTQNSFDTRDVIFKKALEHLEPKNTKTQMIALFGMGGMGKSHMMDQLKKHVKDDSMFNWIVKVVVGKNPDLIALQHSLAEQTGGPLKETTKDTRAERLKNRFAAMSNKGEKKILVILDDLWKVLDPEDIGLSDSPWPNGFKLLITSRYKNVCFQMGVETGSVFKIGALNDDEAKKLFFETVGLSENNDPGLYKIGEEIIKRCGNLPIALKTIASTLKGKTKKESAWKEALFHLQNHDLTDHYEFVHEVFGISYGYLKTEDEKALFLLSGLFPDDFAIPVEELIRYGWGLKLFSKVSTLAKARLRVETCIDSLISANLLAESDSVGCVIMHDLARSFVLSNTTEIKQASLVNHDDISEQLTEDANKSYQRILLKLTAISEFPKDFNCPNLTFLKLMGGVDQLNFPVGFYNNMAKLEVLSYEDVTRPPLLPTSSLCSTHLRTLCLRGCELTSDWFDIGDLNVNLEVLSFAESRIKQLPSFVRKLKKLKLLDLTGCLDLCIDDGVFRDLDQLQELYMRVSGQKAIQFTNDSFSELEKLSMKFSALDVEFFDRLALPKNMSFKNLERFKISIGCLLKDDNETYSYQNTLKLVTSSNDLLSCKINELFNKTEKLHLEVYDMMHLEYALMHPPQESFSKLRVLVVQGCKELRYLFTAAMASGLRKLEQLKVSYCFYLESLILPNESENDGVVIFQELKFLSLDNLPYLKSLCDIEKVVELPQLVELKLQELPEFTSIYHDSTMRSLLNKQVVIPKLEKLDIYRMNNLKQIWPSEITSGDDVQVSMVTVVEVNSCYSLVNLFPINPIPLLCNLKKIEVRRCDSIEVLFNIDLGRRVGKIEEVSSSLRSIHVSGARNLTEVWRIKGVNNSQISDFQAVENIYIHNCVRFREVFTPTTTNFNLNALLDFDMQESLFNTTLNSLRLNSKATKIAICGMGSVGKTKMKEDLVKAVEGTGLFDLVVNLVVGREANVIALQQAMAKYIGEDLTETAKEKRADTLHKRFMQISQGGKKNILVILDDLWEELDLKDIGLWDSPLPNGFRLLITSRDVNVCAQMGVEKSSIFRLGFIDDAKAKSLFFETLGLSKDEDLDPYKIGEEIIRRCGNFPDSFKTIASVLKGNIKDKSKWEEALSLLQNHELEDVYDVLKIAFEMSYNNLKSDDDKAILFLCGFFPKDFYIPMEELMMYAWGLKLFPTTTTTTLAQARHQFKASLDVLVDANFLIISDGADCVKVQPHAHDFVLSNFTEVKQASFDHDFMAAEDAADKSFERIFVDCKGMSNLKDYYFIYPNLIKLLKLMGEEEFVEFPQDFYDEMEKLEVVAYDSMVDPLLPSFSVNLRTLCLNSCSFRDDFSFPGNLINLETLSFAACDIKKLPSTIGKLRRLKVLDVTTTRNVDLSIEDGVFQNLVNLEELYLIVGTQGRIMFTDANYKELEILLNQLCALNVELYANTIHPKDGCFEKLVKFKISMGCRIYYYEYMHYLGNMLKLVSNHCSEVVECKVNELFEKTERLYLQIKDMQNIEQVSMGYSFSNLKELEVSECADLMFLFTVEAVSGLTKLERLKVSRCPVLETLIHGESTEGDGSVIKFPKLKVLHLEKLPRVVSLCDTDNIRVELRQLVELQLGRLANINSIFADDAMQSSFFNQRVQIPNIEKLVIWAMKKLVQIWPAASCEIISATGSGSGSGSRSEKEEVNNIFTSCTLREIEIRGCDGLENLFPRNPLPLLNHLEKLSVEECSSIKVLFNMDLSAAGNINEHTSSLREIQVHELGNLREIWSIKGSTGGGGNINININSSSSSSSSSSSALVIRCFQAVAEIAIYKCPRFRDVFAPKSINFDMRARVIIRED